MFSISADRWRNGRSNAVRILSISAGKNAFLLEHLLEMKKNKYLFLSIFFLFLLRGGEMDEAFLLEFKAFLLEKMHFCWNISLR
jgi:hypothetical protein